MGEPLVVQDLKKMEISNDNIHKVIAPYLGQLVSGDLAFYKGFKAPLVASNHTNSFANGITIDAFMQFACKLILKPLSAISDEDAIEVAKIVGWEYNNNPDSEAHFDLAGLADNIDTMFSEWGFETCIKVIDFLRLIQFLQSRGYDLPHLLLGNKTLKECDLCTYE